jgi:hypothetical protein
MDPSEIKGPGWCDRTEEKRKTVNSLMRHHRGGPGNQAVGAGKIGSILIQNSTVQNSLLVHFRSEKAGEDIYMEGDVGRSNGSQMVQKLYRGCQEVKGPRKTVFWG